MRLFQSLNGMGVRDSVERLVHVILEEVNELGADEESVRSVQFVDAGPDDLFLALGGQMLVFRCVQVYVELRLVRALLLLVVLCLIIIACSCVTLREPFSLSLSSTDSSEQ